ncbi:hypothetical protein L1049_013103 [Liquidambar formosana]|uniref:WRKY domain-containing protein n=1 Tax=Liquidambar formosana TaxID=63359 RepID=A0AAP0RMM4_LIQFO
MRSCICCSSLEGWNCHDSAKLYLAQMRNLKGGLLTCGTCVSQDVKAINVPGGFLYDWWLLFSDMFNARDTRNIEHNVDPLIMTMKTRPQGYVSLLEEYEMKEQFLDCLAANAAHGSIQGDNVLPSMRWPLSGTEQIPEGNLVDLTGDQGLSSSKHQQELLASQSRLLYSPGNLVDLTGEEVGSSVPAASRMANVAPKEGANLMPPEFKSHVSKSFSAMEQNQQERRDKSISLKEQALRGQQAAWDFQEPTKQDELSAGKRMSTGEQRSYDGYNWRKYPYCFTTKKVERSLDGQITMKVYGNSHNQPKPESTWRSSAAASSQAIQANNNPPTTEIPDHSFATNGKNSSISVGDDDFNQKSSISVGVQRSLQEHIQFRKTSASSSGKKRKPNKFAWARPLEGYVKINFDAIVGARSHCAACVARDEGGKLLGMWTEISPGGNKGLAVAAAARLAVRAAEGRKWSHLMLEGIDQSIIDDINSTRPLSSGIQGTLIADVRKGLANLISSVVRKVRMYANEREWGVENREKPNPVAKDGVDGVPKASVDNVVQKEGVEDGVPKTTAISTAAATRTPAFAAAAPPPSASPPPFPTSSTTGPTNSPPSAPSTPTSPLNPPPPPLSSPSNPLPSAKDITETLRLIMSRLHYPSSKLDEDLPIVLKHLNCPIKLNKSALRAPGTPHTWPSFLAVIHWLLQIALYNDHISNSPSIFQNNSMFVYALDSYLHYIRGDDDSVDALDREFMENLDQERDSHADSVKLLGKEVGELEAKLEDLRIAAVEKVLEEKEKELDAKVEEKRRICEESEDSKKRVELQAFNATDVERMKRELQAVERDIEGAEVTRNAWEEKSWKLDTMIGHKFKELEALSIECNQAIRRLKLGNDFHYVLNAKGSTPAEVLGIDYTATLKPALNCFADDIKKSSMTKLEDLISLQQQSVEIATNIEGKRNRVAALQSHIDEVEAQLNLLRKEMQDYISRCAIEAKGMVQDVEAEAHNLNIVEREAVDMLKETIKQCEDETQTCACELFALVDSVSKYKEKMVSTISEMQSNLTETASAVSDAYKAPCHPSLYDLGVGWVFSGSEGVLLVFPTPCRVTAAVCGYG